MKKRSSLILACFLSATVFAADELELPDGTKMEVDVMMYKSGRLMMIKKDGSKAIMSLDEIKSASFEPPPGSFMPMMLSSGKKTQGMVQDYMEGKFHLLTMEGEDQSLAPTEIAAIQFRVKSTIAMEAKEKEVANSKDPKVKAAASKKISDEDMPEPPSSLAMEVPKKIVDGMIDLMELRAEMDVLNNDFEGGKKTESRLEKVMEELKEVNSDISRVVNEHTSKSAKEIERATKEIAKLEDKQTDYSKKDKDVEPILAEKAEVEAFRKKHIDMKNALYWNCTKLEDPSRDSAWLLLGKNAPTTELYVFGKGRVKMDKKARQGVTVYTFWSTKNRDSQKMVSALAEVAKAYARKPLHIYAINVGDNMETLKTTLPKMPRYPNMHPAIDVMDAKGKSAYELYRVMLFPSTYVINAEGKVHSLHISANSKIVAQVEKELAALLKPENSTASPRRR